MVFPVSWDLEETWRVQRPMPSGPCDGSLDWAWCAACSHSEDISCLERLLVLAVACSGTVRIVRPWGCGVLISCGCALWSKVTCTSLAHTTWPRDKSPPGHSFERVPSVLLCVLRIRGAGGLVALAVHMRCDTNYATQPNIRSLLSSA